jgi:ribosomal protein L36
LSNIVVHDSIDWHCQEGQAIRRSGCEMILEAEDPLEKHKQQEEIV